MLIITGYLLYSFGRHLLGTYCVIGTVLGSGDSQMSKTLLFALKDETHRKERVRKLHKRSVVGYRLSQKY